MHRHARNFHVYAALVRFQAVHNFPHRLLRAVPDLKEGTGGEGGKGGGGSAEKGNGKEGGGEGVGEGDGGI